MSELKEIRIEKKLTQKQAADILGVSLRSYKSYENDENKIGTLKYLYMIEKLTKINAIDEQHGIIEIEDIKKKCAKIFEKYDVSFCYLFGSYAKGKAKPDSDVDLLICTDVNGIKYYGLVEEIRTSLNKRIDALDINQLKDNLDLVREILKDGIKIYG